MEDQRRNTRFEKANLFRILAQFERSDVEFLLNQVKVKNITKEIHDGKRGDIISTLLYAQNQRLGITQKITRFHYYPVRRQSYWVVNWLVTPPAGERFEWNTLQSYIEEYLVLQGKVINLNEMNEGGY